MKRDVLVENALKLIISTLARTKPHIYAFIAPFEIYVVDDPSIPTAATDGIRIFVNREFAEKLLSDEKEGYARLATVLLHEAMHAIAMHPERARRLMEEGANPAIVLTVADGKVDVMLREVWGRGNDHPLPDGITVEKLEELLVKLGFPKDVASVAARKWSMERIIHELMEKVRRQQGGGKRQQGQGGHGQQMQGGAQGGSQQGRQGGQQRQGGQGAAHGARREAGKTDAGGEQGGSRGSREAGGASQQSGMTDSRNTRREHGQGGAGHQGGGGGGREKRGEGHQGRQGGRQSGGSSRVGGQHSEAGRSGGCRGGSAASAPVQGTQGGMAGSAGHQQGASNGVGQGAGGGGHGVRGRRGAANGQANGQRSQGGSEGRGGGHGDARQQRRGRGGVGGEERSGGSSGAVGVDRGFRAEVERRGGARGGSGTRGLGGELLDTREGDEVAGRSRRVWEGRKELLEEVRRLLEEGRVEEAAEALAREVSVLADVARRAYEYTSVDQRGGVEGGAKPAGVGKGGLNRRVEELARGRIDWRRLLRDAVLAVNVRDVRRTWSRLNRKLGPVRPGREVIGGIDEVFVAIDVSGSIGPGEYRRFAEVTLDAAAAVRPRRMRIVWWDWGVRRDVTIRNPRPGSVVRVFREGVPGGGGTSIAEVLEKLAEEAKRMRRRMMAIVASDWYTSEAPEAIIEKLIEARRRGAKIVVVAAPESNTEGFEKIAKHADLAVKLPPESPFERAGV